MAASGAQRPKLIVEVSQQPQNIKEEESCCDTDWRPRYPPNHPPMGGEPATHEQSANRNEVQPHDMDKCNPRALRWNTLFHDLGIVACPVKGQSFQAFGG